MFSHYLVHIDLILVWFFIPLSLFFSRRSPKQAPACLNAWFAYRHIVDVILFNDSFNFLFLCLKVMHWPRSLDELTPTLDAVIQRAKQQSVTTTICDGEVIYKDGKFTKVDRTAALKALHDDLSKALADDEVERRKLSVALLPHARRFYDKYMDPSKHVPFYRPSSVI